MYIIHSLLPERMYRQFGRAIALLKDTSNRLRKMIFWQTSLVGYILPRLRHHPSLFRENWGGDRCRSPSIMFCKGLEVKKTMLQKNGQFHLKFLAKLSDQKNWNFSVVYSKLIFFTTPSHFFESQNSGNW